MAVSVVARPWPPPRATTVGPAGGGRRSQLPCSPVSLRLSLRGVRGSPPEGSVLSATFEVPVMDLGREAQALEDPGQLLGQHHAAVVAAGAADADGQVRLPFLH